MAGGDPMRTETSGGSPVGREPGNALERKRPLELLEDGDEWVLCVYGESEGETTLLSTHEARIGAMRTARATMDEDGHPCVLHWDSTDRLGNVYWNPLFERLEVRYDDLLAAWAVVPASGYVLFETAPEKQRACSLARSVQHDYHFKHLDVFAPNDERQQVVDHRFVEDPPTTPGRTVPSVDTETPAATDDAADDDAPVPDRQSTPAQVLDAAVSDLTAITEVETSGPVHRYRATGADDDPVEIATLSPAFTSDRSVMTAFMSVVTKWEEVADAAHVTTVHDVGIGPAPWVAYPIGDGPLAEHVDGLSVRERLRTVCDVASALDIATRYDVPRRGIRPETVRLETRGEATRATLSGWGLRRAVADALDERRVTPYTAPEQLDGETTPTTGTYQLGALTYRLLVDRDPFEDQVDLADAIRQGDLSRPSRVRDAPAAVDDVLLRAMDPEPRDRFTSATAFRDRLLDALQ
ncbi:hypothetical protein ACFQJ5_15830 [Halomicroarcula sp. GCM10025324]|uniref:hypothetical protein n=1 Tax=Haloarcula TaxID=2237 RepID=UPI0023E8072F|nr:hypothetical protein [Halomicroarcula sp. ZS-22-S1]